MPRPEYHPIPLDVSMSDYGYWIVTLSIAPGLRLQTMICSVGITQQQALDAAMHVVPSYPAERRS